MLHEYVWFYDVLNGLRVLTPQVDAVKLTGTLELPAGVVTSGAHPLVEYLPDPLLFGADSFAYVVTDCAFKESRQSEPNTITVNVLPKLLPPLIRSTYFNVSSKLSCESYLHSG